MIYQAGEARDTQKTSIQFSDSISKSINFARKEDFMSCIICDHKTDSEHCVCEHCYDEGYREWQYEGMYEHSDSECNP